MRALPLVCLIGCAVVALASCALPTRYPSQGISRGEGLSRAAGHERLAHVVAHEGEIHKPADTKRQPKAKALQLGSAIVPASQNLPVKAQIVRCAQRVYNEALS